MFNLRFAKDNVTMRIKGNVEARRGVGYHRLDGAVVGGSAKVNRRVDSLAIGHLDRHEVCSWSPTQPNGFGRG